MSYGEGWYGGVYVAAMYSLAYVSDDMEYIVEEALKIITGGKRFSQVHVRCHSLAQEISQ